MGTATSLSSFQLIRSVRSLSRLGSGTEQQNDGSSVNAEEPAAAEDGKVAPTEGVADGDNGTVAASEVLPLEPTPEAAAGARQQEGDAATASQETSRKIEVPNSKVCSSVELIYC